MLKRLTLLLSLFLFSSFSLAEQDFLPPEQAFAIQPSKVVTSVDENRVVVSWKIAEGYYVYRDKVSFTSDDDNLTLGDIELSPSVTKDDPYFGKIQIFKKEFTASIPFTSDKKEGELLFLTAKSQGCAAGGICYPPLKQTVSFTQKNIAQKKKPISDSSNLSGPAVSSKPANALDTLSNLGNNNDAQDDFLDIEEAFKFSLSVGDNNQLSALWSIADKHYLYKNKFKFELIEDNGFSLQQPDMPAGKAKNDEYLGDYEAYYHDLNINIPITGSGDTT